MKRYSTTPKTLHQTKIIKAAANLYNLLQSSTRYGFDNKRMVYLDHNYQIRWISNPAKAVALGTIASLYDPKYKLEHYIPYLEFKAKQFA